MNLQEFSFLYSEILIAQSDLQQPAENQDIPVSKYVVFKTKPNSKITLFLSKEEYNNKELTAFLKKIIVDGLKVPPEEVSFGIVKNAFPSKLLKETPTRSALIFGDFLLDREHLEESMNLCEVYALAEMIGDVHKKKVAWEKMKIWLEKV